jgi:hypothetical protein
VLALSSDDGQQSQNVSKSYTDMLDGNLIFINLLESVMA